MKKAVHSIVFLSVSALFLAFLLPAALAEMPNGTQKDYYEDGTLKSEATYKDGKIDGVGKTYHPNGQLKAEVHYKNGKRHGLRKTYFDNGAPDREENFVEGKRHGECRSWDRKTGRLFTVYPQKHGKMHGKQYVYSLHGPEGWLFIEDEWVDGKLHGKSLMYSALDGTLVVKEANYKDGELDGKVVYYHDMNTAAPGKVRKIETYKNGLLDGAVTHYDARGKLTGIEQYKDGKKRR
jgi:antitoxin component YwqK of YwqJK toxin-antitoxin module